jgi:hypothetical protein
VELREDQAWLFRSRVSASPIAGALALEDGRMRFAVDPGADPDALSWLEAAVGAEGLERRLAGGEAVIAFDHPLEDCVVTWPITGGGAIMLVRAGGRRWVVSYEEPAPGRFAARLGKMSGRRRAREWKKALAESGA